MDSGRPRLADGRAIGVATFGAPDGRPVVALHGMPGSRLMFAAVAAAAARQGVRIIALDRPGYGVADPHPGGTLLGYASDVANVADLLGIERFAVLGVSGGSQYALACAGALGPRVSFVGLVSGIGPLRAPRSLAGMARMNAMVFRLARISPSLVGAVLPRLIRRSLAALDAHVAAGTSPTEAIPPDVLAIVVADQREAIRQGGAGIAFDAANLWRKWAFRLSDVVVPVHLWHGEADDLAPTALARRMAAAIPHCTSTFYPAEGHAEPLIHHADEIMSAF